MKETIPSFSINRERLARVVKSEFELWVENFGKRPMPGAQERRGLFVQWFSVFAPESFEPALVDDLRSIAHEMRHHPEYRDDKWFEMLPIEVALYAHTGDPYWIKIAQLNLNHHNSSLREFVLESLLLVVDRIRFDDTECLARVTSNLEGWHFSAIDSVYFLLMTQGEVKTKKEQIQKWLDQVNLFAGDREELEALLEVWVRSESVLLSNDSKRVLYSITFGKSGNASCAST